MLMLIVLMHQRRRRASLLSPIPAPTVHPGVLPRRVHPSARPRRSVRPAAALHRARRVEN